MMKKLYDTPRLLVHGAVEELTAIEGDPQQTDSVFQSDGTLVGTSEGSIDADPCGPGADDPDCSG